MRRRRMRAVVGLVALLVGLTGPTAALPGAAWASGPTARAAAHAHRHATSTARSGSSSASSTPTTAVGGGALGGITAPNDTVSTTSTATAVATSTTASGSSGISSGTALAIAVAAFLIIVGIGYAILRDARRRTPKPSAAPRERIPGSQRPAKARKLSPAERRRRKRGKAPRRR